MKLLLDTHFLLWILVDSKRLSEFPWLPRYRPWGMSPISLLEIQFLSEIGRVKVRRPDFFEVLTNDPRFILDEAPLAALVQKALPMSWTRDPFDRLLAAHSEVRRTPLCTLDRSCLANHSLVLTELKE